MYIDHALINALIKDSPTKTIYVHTHTHTHTMTVAKTDEIKSTIYFSGYNNNQKHSYQKKHEYIYIYIMHLSIQNYAPDDLNWFPSTEPSLSISQMKIRNLQNP